MDYDLTSVREIQVDDIEHINNYWLKTDPEFLLGMGVDLTKLPRPEDLASTLQQQIIKPYANKDSYALIWEYDHQPIGHTNVNKIKFGNEAYMHLHIWKSDLRRKGIGTDLVLKSLPFYFKNLRLQNLFCEPYALNPAPNKTLEKVGFEFIKQYRTIPGNLNSEQMVKRWKLTRVKYLELASRSS